ncbi:hypothetical protein ACH4E8_10030 [Streptomyces sp. NPDC017979]|uniref:hypothetical protein n=1 Tax=Streptomyces sp. NPDC017979 TaxID=3365024 RepID=UPI003794B300
MTRRRTGPGAIGLVCLLALTAGCSTAPSGGSKPSGSAGSASPVTTSAALRAAEAQTVFEEYAEVNAAADAALDDTAIARVQTGALLRESLAEYAVAREARRKVPVTSFTRPTFLLPSGKADAHPRWFASISKWRGREDDRQSALHYFVQEEKDGPWRAAAASWVVTDPGGARPPAAPPKVSTGKVRTQPPVLPTLDRAATGTVRLSPRASEARAACRDFAARLSFTVPDGRAPGDRFTAGPFTEDLVAYANGLADEALERSYAYRAQEDFEPPVFRLSTGGSLVPCTLTREHRVTGRDGAAVVFDAGSDTDVLLGGGERQWRRVTEVSSVNALIAVPAREGVPATVVSCDCYDPQTVSATGRP